MPAALPALVSTWPLSTYSTSGSTRTSGWRRRSSSAHRQWVVAGRPSSRPAAASAKAPEQIDTTRAPRACAVRSAATTAGGTWPYGSGTPTTTAVSAAASSSRP